MKPFVGEDPVDGLESELLVEEVLEGLLTANK